MKCDDMLLEDYVEGFLTGVERMELETHLNTCKQCQQTLENLKTEQRLLFTALNEAPVKKYPTEHLMQEIKQHKQTKARRQRYKMLFITAAIFMISFTLITTMNQPSQLADVPKDLHINEPHTTGTAEETNTYGIPLNAGPVFEFNIDSVVEKNNMKKITYHVNYNDVMQHYADTTFQKLVNTYELDIHDLPYRGLHALVSSAVRNSQNEVIATFDVGENESIKPIYPTESLYSQATEVLGEQIKYFSLPVENDPTTFEILSYFAELPTFTEPIMFKNKTNTTFDYIGHAYTIDDIQLTDDGLQLSISVDGKPDIIPSGWYITFNGVSQRNVTFHKIENNQTIITVILPQMKTIPEEMTMLPYLGLIEEKFKPSMSLDLN